MRKHLLFLLLLLATAASAQQSTDTQTNLRRHIEYLASDKLEGRRTGEPGAILAAGYIANQFVKAGLKPGASTGSGKSGYMQQFPYVTGVEMTANNRFSLQVSDSTGQRNTSVATQAKPVGFSPNATVGNTGVVYAGYGIVSKDPGYDDYKYQDQDIDVRGKVVLVFDGYPDNDNPHSPFGRFDLRTKALIAKDHGAAGMLVISREDVFEHDRLTRLTYDQSLGEAAIPTFVISRETANAILGLHEGDLRSLEDLTAMKASMPGHKVAYGFRDTNPMVSFAVTLEKKAVPAYNVIGILPGKDKTLKNEAIVIGAHYDHLGHGGNGSLAANSTEIHHGADDNASGVAAIIEIARQFARDKANKRTIIFIAFSGEEEGLFGSQFYVNNPIFPLETTVAMINLDMVGRLNENKLTIGGMGTASEWASLVKINDGQHPTVGNPDGSFYRFPAFNLQLNDDGFGPSDHSSFYGKKIPVLFFFTGTHNDYHKPTDTADKINYAGEASVIEFVTAIAKAIDRNPARPTYTVAKVTMAGGRTGFNVSLGTIPNYADSTDGLMLDGVRDDSPAAKAGVKAGDKVIKLAGHDIRNVMDYTFVLGEMKAGQEYEIVVRRGSETLTFTIVPVKR